MNIISSDVETNKGLANKLINLFYYCLNSKHKKSVKKHKGNINLF